MDQSMSNVGSVILSLLFFPTFFEKTLLVYFWGAQDPFWLLTAKRLFFLLPAGAVLLCLWASILCLLTVIVRQKRVEFLKAFCVTWWDLLKSIFAFWGGFLKLGLVLAGTLYGFLRILVVGLWMILQDILLVPFRLIRSVAQSVSTPGIPWIAVLLTFFWCLVEALVFTYVMTPLVMDTLSNLTGEDLNEFVIRIPLFLFMVTIILGSYSVLSAWTKALKTRDAAAIVKITLVEAVAAFVEVLFLYRELVDSLVPWFAQHTASDFDLGIGGTLAIGLMAWLGVRAMTWFLFASHGVPVITAVIQGSGLKKPVGSGPSVMEDAFAYTVTFFNHFKKDADWVHQKADELLGSFILPPLQVISAVVNFFILLIASRHLFDLPFKSFREIMRSKELLESKPIVHHPKVKKTRPAAKPVAVPGIPVPPSQPLTEVRP
jgi:hypothetical protein